MWPIIAQFLRANSRYIALPFAIIVGFVGFNIEGLLRSQEDISSTKALPKTTVSDARLKRQMSQDLSSEVGAASEAPSSALQYRGEPMFDKNK
ncbi:hypothetical protein PHET_04940 [Paragonimus heterotremus]|uniref:Small integral membrane protein 12 n=1 Tax=Paragonimus heterotremus TaxID=100268 RepID=A0A8J4SFJ3_9TREM|nr:hypothetical protein PHET_04940 [Paragonimus heterotremus]